MNQLAEIAFYAPMKPLDHPVPSGDRTMARLLYKALQCAGFMPQTASALRSFEPAGHAASQEALRVAALAEADRLIALWHGAPRQPKLWFSYHVYYKSPDWIGPRVSKALGIPYVVAEGSRAMKRADGPWRIAHAGAEQALDNAAVIFAMTQADEHALISGKTAAQRIVSLPPFIDLSDWPDRVRNERREGEPARLLAVAMMREGDKLQSYRLLAAALRYVKLPWRLDIVGDGSERDAVRALFAPFGASIVWHGEIIDRTRLANLYAAADLLVWPAVNEAYGMVFLEAQANGCPVVAGNRGGVSSVVCDGVTGVLVGGDDVSDFGGAIANLLTDSTLRHKLADNARRFVRTERNLDTAAGDLRKVLGSLMEGGDS